VVEIDLMLGPVATIVAKLDVVVAEPMGVVAGILAEPVEPKEVVLGMFSEVDAPMAAAAESPFVTAVATGFGVLAALVVGLDPR